MFWKRWTGYHVRSRIEAKMRCLKAFGERIAARHPDSQTAEIQIRIALMNRFSALGTADIVRLGILIAFPAISLWLPSLMNR